MPREHLIHGKAETFIKQHCSPGPMPLEAGITVGILTVDDPVYRFCRRALNNQDFQDFRVEVIRNISPFNAAFQELTQRVETEFFIGLDEDMILYSYAVRRMLEAISAAPPEVAMVCFHLYDQDRCQNIHGIKVFRTSALRQVQARNVKASEMDLLEQLLEKGFRWVIHPEVMGMHGTFYSPESIYHRYRSMYEKDIRTWNLVGADIRRKAEGFRQSGDPQELFALLGAAHGVIGASLAPDAEKDFRQYQTHTLAVLKKLLLGPDLPGQAYDEKASATVFKSAPLSPQDVSWKTSGIILDDRMLADSARDEGKPEDILCRDMMIMGQLSEQQLQPLLSARREDPYTYLWLGLYLWRVGKYAQAQQSLAQARDRGAPLWRCAFHQALVIRDDSNNLGLEKYALARELIGAVLAVHPELETARLYNLYLNGYFSGDGIDVLIEDFFACNQPVSESFVNLSDNTGRPRIYVQRLQECGWRAADTRLPQTGCGFVHLDDGLALLTSDEAWSVLALRPALTGLKYDGCYENRLLLMQLLEGAGYVLWHGAPDYLLFREKRTLCAPDFWCQRRTLPVRQIPLN